MPLIDVLLLLFCIFLLMPFANEEDMEKTQEEAIKERDNATTLRAELDRREDDLQNIEISRQDMKNLREYERIKAENEEMRKKLSEVPDQKYIFHIIDIDGDTGELYIKDARGRRRDIKNEQAAKKQIKDDRDEANKNPMTKGKRLYYCFVYPRRGVEDAYPVLSQIEEYKKWFAEVEISFLKGAAR